MSILEVLIVSKLISIQILNTRTYISIVLTECYWCIKDYLVHTKMSIAIVQKIVPKKLSIVLVHKELSVATRSY